MKDPDSTGKKETSATGRQLWAYAYQMSPPQAEHRMEQIRALLEQENQGVRESCGTSVGRMIVEPQVTHVLIVSDSPELNRKLNNRLEDSFRELDVRWTVTVPMRLGDAVKAVEE